MGGNMQIRKITLILILFFGVFVLGSSMGFCADVAKIGTINFQKIFESSTAGKTAKEEITREGQRMEAELKKEGDEIKSIQEMLERDAGVLSKEARDEKKWQLSRKLEDAKALKRKYDRQIQEFQMEHVNQIKKDVFDIIQEYGKKEGYLLILETIGVIYAPDSLDVTDQIIKIYNTQYDKKGKK
jgi:outer membrane protein